MRKILLFFSFLLALYTAKSQKTEIAGRVSDNLDNPVKGIIISLINAETGNVIKYSYTGTLGEFKFQVESSMVEHAALSVKSAFYNPVTTALVKNQGFYIVSLTKAIIKQAPVEISAPKAMVRRTGDTIRYHLSSFANRNDKVIADVLPKIPGIEVNNNGLIKYNGMPISNFYIDGDNILDKRYSIATSNISNDIVDEIQILENNQPIKVLQGISVPYNAAINITFKKGFRGKIVHNANLGVGTGGGKPLNIEKEYNQVVLRAKIKGINVFKYNNTGIDYMAEHTQQDINDLRKEMETNWTAQLLGMNTAASPPIQKHRFNVNSNFSGSVNMLFRLKNDFLLRSNSYYLRDHQYNEYHNITQIFLPGINFGFREDQQIVYKPQVFYQQFVLNKNSVSGFFNNQLTVEINKNSAFSDLKSAAVMSQNLNFTNINLLNELRYIKKVKTLLLEFNSYTSLNQNPQSLFTSPGALKNVVNGGVAYDFAKQEIDNVGLVIKNQASLGFNKAGIKLNGTIGAIISKRSNYSRLFISNDARFENTVLSPDSFANNSNTIYTKTFALLNFILERKKNKLDISVSPSVMHLKTEGLNIHPVRDFFFAVNTSAGYKRQMGRENSIRMLYTFRNEPGEIGNSYPGRYLQNYRTIFYNPLTYLPERKHNIYACYNLQRSLKLLFVTLSASKSFSTANYMLSHEVLPSATILSYFLNKNRQQSFNSSLTASKYFFRLKSTLGLKMNYSQRDLGVNQNSKVIQYKNKSQQLILTFRPSFNKIVQFNTELSVTKFTTQVSNIDNLIPANYKYSTNSGLDFFLTDEFSFKLKGETVAFKSATADNNTNCFMDGFVKFTPKRKKISYQLNALNIFNRKSYSLQQMEVSYFQLSEYYIRPFSVVFTMNVKF